MENIAGIIDHTILKQDASFKDVERICLEAIEYKFWSVCVNSSYVSFAYDILKKSGVKVCSVVGFPLGAMISEAKAYEASKAIENGAEEIDMVINVGFIKSKRLRLVEEDIKKVREASGNKLLKVIIETCLLTDDEKKIACKISKELNADFVKTSTGFSTSGANEHDVKLMRDIVGPSIGVKASGGVRTYEDALKMIKAGANRLGTSNGIAIVTGK